MPYQDPKSSDLERFKAIFLLANIPVSEWVAILYEDEDPYWFLAVTKDGMIEIGREKETIYISRSRTNVGIILSKDETTKKENYIHVQSSIEAIAYLSLWKKESEVIEKKEELEEEVSKGLEEPELNQYL